MGQINTNNYPTVDSLADADLLIVENAIHGTGTTTPKQLRENAIGTDPLQTTAQTVTGAINEIFEMATDTVVGLELGKMTSFSDGVIVTDIDLHRAPVAGDRILFYHSTSVASPSSLTTYNDGVAVTTTIGDFSMTHPAGLTLMKCVALGESLRWQTVQDIASGYTAGTGISINGTTISNSAPQLGDDIAYSRIDSVTSGALGYFSADADCLVMDFRTDAEPYNGGYTLRLTTTGASFKYAVLKDKAGNNYAEEIPSGSLVMCKSNVSGTGSEADPVVVTVLEIGNTEMAHDVEVLKDICITEKTASGNPITITDALPYNAVSLSAEIEAIQDLHGYDHPWVGGANVQLVDFSTYTSLSNNISFDYTDGDVILTSTDTTSNYPSVVFSILNLKGKTLYFSDTFTSSDEGLGHIQIIYTVNGQQTYLEVGKTPNPQTGYTIPNDVTTADLKLYLRNGTSIASGKWVKYGKIMCALSANPTYSPYSNICPISGHTSVTITRTDAESQTADFTIALGQTVYGGTVNVTTGVLTIKTKMLTFDGSSDENWGGYDQTQLYGIDSNNIAELLDVKIVTPQSTNNESGLISNLAKEDTQYNSLAKATIAISKWGNINYFYVGTGFTGGTYDLTAFKALLASAPLQVEYPLATPTTIQLTPTQLTMLKGYNQISSDGGGDITLIYKADRLAAIEAALAAL